MGNKQNSSESKISTRKGNRAHMEHSYRVTMLALLLFKVWKTDHLLGVYPNELFNTFSRKMKKKKKKKGKLPPVKPENGSCNANTQSEMANERRMVCNGAIKDESSRDFKLSLHKRWRQGGLFKFVWLDLSTNDLFYKTASLSLKPCNLHWPSSIIFLSLTFTGLRTQIRTPNRIFTVCVLEPFTPLIDTSKISCQVNLSRRINKRRHEIQIGSLPGNVMWKAMVLLGGHVLP